MAQEPLWLASVREALRPHIGALAYVVVDDTLRALGMGAEQMNVRKIIPFLGKLKGFLPAEVDREALATEVGRILLDGLVRGANHP